MMRVASLALAAALFCLSTSLRGGESPSRVVLLGDSTVITSYLPTGQAHAAVLQARLDERFGPGAAEVINWADNGEFIARFLINGAYEKFRARTPGADLFLIRFGINDQKRYAPEEFGRQLELLIDLLHADFPEAGFVLETGQYADPAHYSSDRNRQLAPYWEQARSIAARRGLPLCDIYQAMEEETRAGRWDLRIRNAKPGEPPVLDASRDAENTAGMRWFSNIHPNPEGVRVAAGAEAQLLGERFPAGLPRGGGKAERAAKSSPEYEALLGVTRASLEVRSRRAAADSLQTPVQK